MNVPAKPDAVVQAFKDFVEARLGITLKEI
jgi:hypothetical protein